MTCYLHPLHELIMKGSCEFGKEENLLLLLSILIQQYGQPFEQCIPECPGEIEKACAFMEQHYAERIYLDQICRYAGLSKSTLLRAFTRSKGVTPYSYLENIRIGKAKNCWNKESPLSKQHYKLAFLIRVISPIISTDLLGWLPVFIGKSF